MVMNMTTTVTTNENSRIGRNALVGVLGAALTAVAWLIWWPVALGLAFGATTALIKPETQRWIKLSSATAILVLVATAGFFAGATAVAVVSLICFVGLALKA
jgi:hypothetical protein